MSHDTARADKTTDVQGLKHFGFGEIGNMNRAAVRKRQSIGRSGQIGLSLDFPWDKEAEYLHGIIKSEGFFIEAKMISAILRGLATNYGGYSDSYIVGSFYHCTTIL